MANTDGEGCFDLLVVGSGPECCGPDVPRNWDDDAKIVSPTRRACETGTCRGEGGTQAPAGPPPGGFSAKS